MTTTAPAESLIWTLAFRRKTGPRLCILPRGVAKELWERKAI